MAFFVNDVKYISSTKNLSDFGVPASAVSGYQLPSVADGFVGGAVYAYSARSSDGLFESGTGINDGNSQARTTINDGSSGPGVKVDFVTFPTVVITVLRAQIGNLQEDNTWLGQNTFSNLSFFDETVTMAAPVPAITGPELISNPTFVASSTGWTIGDAAQTTWTPGHFSTIVTDGSLSSQPWISTQVTVNSGQWYAVVVNQTVVNDETVVSLPRGFDHVISSSNGVSGDFTFYILPVQSGAQTLTIDLDFYKVGATRDITGVSMKACDAPPEALSVLDTNGETNFEIGGITSAMGEVVIGQNALPSRGCPGAIAIGGGVLFHATEGVSNTVIGRAACFYSTTGHDNTVLGNFAMSYCTTGYGNTHLGSGAGYRNDTGRWNITIGVNAGSSITSGSENVVIGGGLTGGSLVTASGSIIIGANMDSVGDTSSYLNIGNEIKGVMGGLGLTFPNGITIGATPSIQIDSANSRFQVQGTNITGWHESLLIYGNNAGGAGFAFYKTRNADPTLKTTVVANDTLGYFDWYGTDGTSDIDGANLRVKVDGTVSTGNLGGRFEFLTRAAGGSMTQRMSIAGAGYVTLGAAANVVIDSGQSVAQVQGSNLTFHQSWLAYGNNAGGASLVFYKTRNADPTVQTSVNANDTLGYLDWYGTDGTNQIDGANMRVRVDGAVASGSLGGKWELLTRPAGGSMTVRLVAPGAGGLVIGNVASTLSTAATDGFLYIPTCAGTPTGTPTTQTGTVALVYDTTNNKFYIYNGAWKGGTAPGVWS